MRPVTSLLVALIVLAGGVRRAEAQSKLEYWSDVPTDARSAALGEAFVAAAVGVSAMFYNVAGLAATKGIGYSSDFRTNDNGTIPGYHQNQASLSAMIGTGSLGSAGFRWAAHLDAFNQFERRDTANRFVGLFRSTFRIDDFKLAYAASITPTLDAGIGIGLVLRTTDDASLIDTVPSDHSAHTVPYVTFGFRYHESILHSSVNDEFSFSASLDHLGARLRTEDPLFSTDLSRSLRAGIAWHIAQPETTAFADEFLSALISGQYKKILNEQPFTSDQVNTNKGYWSLGLEVGAWDVLFLRYGLQYRPYDSKYALRDNAQQNYGGGARLPLHRIIPVNSPLWLNVDYAQLLLLNNRTEHILSVGIRIDHDFFPTPPAEPERE